MKDKVNDKKNVEDGFAYCAEHFGVSVDEVKEDIKDLFDSMRFSENAKTRDSINRVFGESSEDKTAVDMVAQLLGYLDQLIKEDETKKIK